MIKWNSESFETAENTGEKTENQMASTGLQWDIQEGLLRGLSCASGMDPEKMPTVYTHIKAMKSKGNLNDVSVKTDVEQRS